LGKLTLLDLGGCEEIQDIQPLAWLPSLVELDLHYCSKIKSFYPISSHKNLEKLAVTLSHNDLSFLRNLHQLKELNFVCCLKLDNIVPLERLRKLEKLQFYHCKLVTQGMADKIKRKLPNCRVSCAQITTYP